MTCCGNTGISVHHNIQDGAVKYNTMILTAHIPHVLKASFVRVQCGSAQLSISLSQVTVSSEIAAPAQSGAKNRAARFPSHDCWLELTHDYCVMTWAKRAHCTSHHSVWIGVWLLTEGTETQSWLSCCDNKFITVELEKYLSFCHPLHVDLLGLWHQ